jgi:hypothetical protein
MTQAIRAVLLSMGIVGLVAHIAQAAQERRMDSYNAMNGVPIECMRWPYPAYCHIAGVRWHPNRQQIEAMRGGSWEGLCWMLLIANACTHMDTASAGPVRPPTPAAGALQFSGPTQTWRTYTAKRFGGVVDVPADWSIEPPPLNNDGRGFLSPDGQAKLTIAGMFISPRGEGVIDARDGASALEKWTTGKGMVIYKRTAPDWAVTSGFTSDQKIFYIRAALACHGTVINGVEITYPQQRKQEFDPLVRHVSQSFHSSRFSDECGPR